MTIGIIQILVLLISVVLLISIVLVGASRSASWLLISVALGLLSAFLLNVGAALIVSQGSVVGIACVLVAVAVVVMALRSHQGHSRRER